MSTIDLSRFSELVADGPGEWLAGGGRFRVGHQGARTKGQWAISPGPNATEADLELLGRHGPDSDNPVWCFANRHSALMWLTDHAS